MEPAAKAVRPIATRIPLTVRIAAQMLCSTPASRLPKDKTRIPIEVSTRPPEPGNRIAEGSGTHRLSHRRPRANPIPAQVRSSQGGGGPKEIHFHLTPFPCNLWAVRALLV